MVSTTRTIKTLNLLLIRIFVLTVIFILAFITTTPFHDFIINTLEYNRPSGFFGFTFADWELAWLLSLVFWSGIILGTIGKKTDYILITIIFLIALWDYSYPPAVSILMHAGLFGVLFLGNTIGYFLKLARLKWIEQKSPRRNV